MSRTGAAVGIYCGIYIVGLEDKPLSESLKQIPLKSVNVQAEIIDCVSHVTVTHKYENESKNRLEAVYKFPLDEKAAVSAFEVTFDDGRIIKGLVKEKEEAAKEYTQAIQQGVQAGLLEQEKTDVFQSSIGNIEPGQKVSISISYVSEIENDDENTSLRFVLPSTVAPRYHSAKHADSDPAGGNVVAGQSFDKSANYTLSVECMIQMSGKILEVKSVSHQIQVELSPKSETAGVPADHFAKVHLARNDVLLDRDFVLVVDSEKFDYPRAMVEFNKESKTNCVMLTMVPRFKLEGEFKGEFIFVVDRSGSMGGFKIQKAREALQLFIKSLPEDSYFNILGFGSNFELLFPGKSEKYTDSTVSTAQSHLEGLDANLGGTELFQPFNHLLSSVPLIKGYERLIFVLTDGEVDNTDRVLSLVTDTLVSQPKTRFFSIGIGNGVSRALVGGVATNGKGNCEYVMEGERSDKKVLLLLKQATQSRLSNLTVQWCEPAHLPKPLNHPTLLEKAKSGVLSFFDPHVDVTVHPPNNAEKTHCDFSKHLVQQAPCECPPLYVGKRFVVYAMLKDGVPVPKSVKVKADSTEGPIELDIAISHSLSDANKKNPRVLHLLAARHLIQDMQNGKSYASYKLKNTGAWNGEDWVMVNAPPSAAEYKQEIVRLGVLFQLMSSHTSFLAVDKSGKKVNQAISLEKQVVPTLPDAGGHGGQFFVPPAHALSSMAPQMMMAGFAMPGPPPPSVACAPPPAMPYPSMSMPPGAPMASFAPTRPSAQPKKKAAPRKASAPNAAASPMRYEKEENTKRADNVDFESGDMAMEVDDFAAPAPVPVLDKHALLLSLVSHQSVSGAFDDKNDLESLIELPNLTAKWTEFCSANKITGSNELKKVWITIAVVLYFEVKLADLKDEWELIRKKANKWVQKTLNDESGKLNGLKEDVWIAAIRPLLTN